MLLVYIPCENVASAEELGKCLLSKRLCGCVNILPKTKALFFWPKGSPKIEKNTECVVLLKTVEGKFKAIEKEVKKIHSYEIPCILGIPILFVSKSYKKWLLKEMRLV